MSDDKPKELIADDDIEAALAEIEQLSDEEVDKIPSLDDGTDDESDPPPPDPVPLKTKAAESEKKETAEASTAVAAPTTEPDDKPESVAQAPAPDNALAQRLYRWTDTAIALADRPVRRFNDSTRKMIGWVSATTLLVALLAALVLPAVFPQRDAITFLQEKRAAFNAVHALESDSSP